MSSRLRWEQDVAACVATRPHLLPIFGDARGIVDYLREWNPNLFVALNLGRVMDKLSGRPYEEWRPLPLGIVPKWNAWYEIHNLAEKPTLVMAARNGELDYRAVQDIMKSDIRYHGDAVYREMEESNERLEEARRRENHNHLDAFARDNYRTFARAHWGPTVFGPGGPPRTAEVK